MRFLTEKGTIPIPHPPQMGNKGMLIIFEVSHSGLITFAGNYIISLSAFTRWLASVAENHYGVEIYPGFSGASLLFSEKSEHRNPWNGWQNLWGTEVTKIFSRPPPGTSPSQCTY